MRLRKEQWEAEQETRIRNKLPKAGVIAPKEETLVQRIRQELRQGMVEVRRKNPLPTEDDFRVIVVHLYFQTEESQKILTTL